MGVLSAFTVGLVFWLTAWALGVKAFDAFMVTVGLLVIAVAGRLITPFVRQQLGKS
jgi:hypothetical protein